MELVTMEQEGNFVSFQRKPNKRIQIPDQKYKCELCLGYGSDK
jgi:hypothetical protein